MTDAPCISANGHRQIVTGSVNGNSLVFAVGRSVLATVASVLRLRNHSEVLFSIVGGLSRVAMVNQLAFGVAHDEPVQHDRFPIYVRSEVDTARRFVSGRVHTPPKGLHSLNVFCVNRGGDRSVLQVVGNHPSQTIGTNKEVILRGEVCASVVEEVTVAVSHLLIEENIPKNETVLGQLFLFHCSG